MMSHGAPSASRLNRENGASLSADSFDEERQLARAEPSARGRQTPAQARPVKAVSRQSRARASASLDRRPLVRQRHSKRRPLSNAKPRRARPVGGKWGGGRRKGGQSQSDVNVRYCG